MQLPCDIRKHDSPAAQGIERFALEKGGKRGGTTGRMV